MEYNNLFWYHQCIWWTNCFNDSDRVYPKMSPLILLSRMYRELFILRRNRTNSWYRAHMYFSNCFFVRWIEDSYRYYKINSRYTYVLKFCFNVIWLWFFPCFGAKSEIMYIFWYISIFPAKHTQRWLQRSNCSCVYIYRDILQHRIRITPTQQPLKDRAVLGVSRSWWDRSWLRCKSPGFR